MLGNKGTGAAGAKSAAGMTLEKYLADLKDSDGDISVYTAKKEFPTLLAVVERLRSALGNMCGCLGPLDHEGRAQIECEACEALAEAERLVGEK